MVNLNSLIFITFCSLSMSCKVQSSSKENENHDSIDDEKPINLTIVDLKVDHSDEDIPDYLKSALVDATLSEDALMNEYAPYSGLPRLNSAIATFYSKLSNRTLDPKSEVLVTVGASEALFATFSTLSLKMLEAKIIGRR